jgi:hypothetical protein
MDQIEDIFASVVEAVGHAVTIIKTKEDGSTVADADIDINYVFGSAQYIKDVLDVRSRGVGSNMPLKFPLIALQTPNVQTVDSGDYQYRTKINLIIACSSRKEWSNEKRMETSFKRVLLPIYEKLIEVLLRDRRFEWNYGGLEYVPHTMSKNFDYGRYGAMTPSGQEVSEPIDAIDVRSLEIKVNNQNCVREYVKN